jgi:hypothetical protein
MVSACRVLAPAFWLLRARLRQQIRVISLKKEFNDGDCRGPSHQVFLRKTFDALDTSRFESAMVCAPSTFVLSRSTKASQRTFT